MITKIMTAVLTWFGTTFTTLFSSWRYILFGAFLTFAGVMLYNLISEVLQEVLTWTAGKYSTIGTPSGAGGTYSFTGFVGCMLSYLKIPQCMSFIVTTLAFKFIMRKIPFIKW